MKPTTIYVLTTVICGNIYALLLFFIFNYHDLDIKYVAPIFTMIPILSYVITLVLMYKHDKSLFFHYFPRFMIYVLLLFVMNWFLLVLKINSYLILPSFILVIVIIRMINETGNYWNNKSE